MTSESRPETELSSTGGMADECGRMPWRGIRRMFISTSLRGDDEARVAAARAIPGSHADAIRAALGNSERC